MRKPTRRQFLKHGSGTAAAGAWMVGPRGARARSSNDRPHILYLMGDQHRGDCLGVDGHPCVATPNLDAIAKEGVHFRKAYTSTPTCTPARSALLTGLSPWQHGMLGYGKVALRYPLETPRALRDAGYYTTGIGKMHWHPQRNLHGFHQTILDESGRIESPNFRSDYRSWFWSEAPTLDPDATGIGWNDYRSWPYKLPERLHPTHWTGVVATEFLRNYNRKEPFFLKVSFARPHSPYDAPERFQQRYRNAEIPTPVIGAWAKRYTEPNTTKPSLWHGDLGAEQTRRSRQGYYGSVTFIDEQIGRILGELDRRGWLEETLIIYFADHGDMTGDHNLWRKSYAYEASARIPMVMRWPKGMLSDRRGQVRSEVVELRDILPTFLDAAGAGDLAASCDGRSLLDLLRGKTEDWREYIDLEHDVCYSKQNHWNALTDGRHKYIYHALDGEEQLFNLEADPGECNDLAPDPKHGGTLRLWRQRMVDHLSERGAPFVVHGRLEPRPERMLYSPNYPRETGS